MARMSIVCLLLGIGTLAVSGFRIHPMIKNEVSYDTFLTRGTNGMPRVVRVMDPPEQQDKVLISQGQGANKQYMVADSDRLKDIYPSLLARQQMSSLFSRAGRHPLLGRRKKRHALFPLFHPARMFHMMRRPFFPHPFAFAAMMARVNALRMTSLIGMRRMAARARISASRAAAPIQRAPVPMSAPAQITVANSQPVYAMAAQTKDQPSVQLNQAAALLANTLTDHLKSSQIQTAPIASAASIQSVMVPDLAAVAAPPLVLAADQVVSAAAAVAPQLSIAAPAIVAPSVPAPAAVAPPAPTPVAVAPPVPTAAIVDTSVQVDPFQMQPTLQPMDVNQAAVTVQDSLPFDPMLTLFDNQPQPSVDILPASTSAASNIMGQPVDTSGANGFFPPGTGNTGGFNMVDVTGTPMDMMSGTPMDMLSGTPMDMMSGTPMDMATGTPMDMISGTPMDIAPGTQMDMISGSPMGMFSGTEMGMPSGSMMDMNSGASMDMMTGTQNPLAGDIMNGNNAQLFSGNSDIFAPGSLQSDMLSGNQGSGGALDILSQSTNGLGISINSGQAMDNNFVSASGPGTGMSFDVLTGQGQGISNTIDAGTSTPSSGFDSSIAFLSGNSGANTIDLGGTGGIDLASGGVGGDILQGLGGMDPNLGTGQSAVIADVTNGFQDLTGTNANANSNGINQNSYFPMDSFQSLNANGIGEVFMVPGVGQAQIVQIQ